jgi:hypothetical protein
MTTMMTKAIPMIIVMIGNEDDDEGDTDDNSNDSK